MRPPFRLPAFIFPLWRRIYRRARLDLWFPHVPLALAVGGAGALALLPTIDRYAQEYLHLQLSGLFDALHPLSAQVPALILRGVPTAVIGLLQVESSRGSKRHGVSSWAMI